MQGGLTVQTDSDGESLCLAYALEAALQAYRGGVPRSNIKTLFVLTTVTDHWFLEHGFVRSSPEALPETRQRLYNYQRNSKVLRKDLSA